MNYSNLVQFPNPVEYVKTPIDGAVIFLFCVFFAICGYLSIKIHEGKKEE